MRDVTAALPSPTLVAGWMTELARSDLLHEAMRLKREGHGDIVSFSPKVFIPLTQLCRDTCGYCTFAHPPRRGERAFMTPDQVLAVARSGATAGCTEALFTLGERPEDRYRVVREELSELGHATTLDYLIEMAALVQRETGLLPHLNAGVMEEADLLRLRGVSVSQGLMLEGTAPALLERGGAHFGSKGKIPAVRLETIAAAGRQAIPFTSGILIGLGESRAERVEAMLALAALHREYGHIQEIIVQNFQPKPGTRMAAVAPPPLEELLWSIAAGRLIFGPQMNIQAPPNLSFDRFPELLAAGINDWGGVSPITPDHVNPEARWPARDLLSRATEAAGATLVARLPIYPAHVAEMGRWIDPSLHAGVLRAADADGWARDDRWAPGKSGIAPVLPRHTLWATPEIDRIIARAADGERLEATQVARLFRARGAEISTITSAADALRKRVSGDLVRYVVNRNINYTNICAYKCSFCAFSKGKTADHLRGRPYLVDLDEVSRRAAEAWDRGATEVCMQGGIHPSFTGQTYLDLLAAVRRGAPQIHIHAFSPLEVTHGAETLGRSVPAYLERLREAGLGSLPGTAAEILTDRARALLCPDKLTTRGWIEVIAAAHAVGLPTTSTIMFGHIDGAEDWAAHLLALRDLQERSGGITEFVPLPFVHMEAPMYHRGQSRQGPTFREVVLMHAIARLALHPVIPNIQVSWCKLGAEGVLAALDAGANDLGGTLMNESISRAAGTEFGQELPPAEMDALIARAGRQATQRSTLYRPVPPEQLARSYRADMLAPLVTGEIGPARTRRIA